ncbi:hypothetical protein MJH12_01610 [bacterium]|nr:hypothetical protein [bacterium]
MTTHNLKEAEEICDRICIINHGKVLALDETKNLVKRLGDTKSLELQFQQLPKNLDILNHFQFKTHPDAPEITINYNSQQISELLTLVNALDQKALDMKIKEDSLEDVFKHLIGVA